MLTARDNNPAGKPSESADAWDPRADGSELLKHLGGLALQAEANLWTSSALFGAAEGVLLLALFSVIAASYSAVSVGYSATIFMRWWEWAIAISGMMFSVAWFGVSWLLLNRRRNWISKAMELQTQTGIPNRFAPWGAKSARILPEVALFIIAWLPFPLMWFFLLGGLASAG